MSKSQLRSGLDSTGVYVLEKKPWPKTFSWYLPLVNGVLVGDSWFTWALYVAVGKQHSLMLTASITRRNLDTSSRKKHKAKV